MLHFMCIYFYNLSSFWMSNIQYTYRNIYYGINYQLIILRILVSFSGWKSKLYSKSSWQLPSPKIETRYQHHKCLQVYKLLHKKDFLLTPSFEKDTVLSCQAWILDHGAWTSRFHSSERRVHAIQTPARQPISCLIDCYVNNALLASAPVFTCTQSVNLLSKAFTSFLSRDSPTELRLIRKRLKRFLFQVRA